MPTHGWLLRRTQGRVSPLLPGDPHQLPTVHARLRVGGLVTDQSPTHVRLGASYSQGSSLTYVGATARTAPGADQVSTQLFTERMDKPLRQSPHTPRDLREHDPKGNENGDLADL